MKFSLILCTVNREKEVIDFLDSLVEQIYKNFEVIVVDQNYDNRVKNIIEKYTCLNIIYLKSDLGLSKARNIGLKRAIGDIVCFPDDDCTYPFVLLENVKNFFEKNVYHILMGKTVDFKTGKIVAGSNRLIEQELTTFYTLGSSTTLFIKNNHQIIFDERFGLGSIYASEEENELIFRLLKNGYKGYYNPNINYVYHPPSDLDYKDTKRVKVRSIGLGAFIAKHLFSIEGLLYFLKYNIFRTLLGSLLFFIKLDFVKSKFYFIKLVVILKCFFKYFMNKNENNI